MLKWIIAACFVSMSCVSSDLSQDEQATGTPGYAITTSPSLTNIAETGQATMTVTVSPFNGYTGSVSLSPSGLPSNTTASFSPQPVVITSGSVNSTMTLTTTNAPDGAYIVNVTGDDGNPADISNSSNCCSNLQVGVAPDYSLAVTPSSISVHRGSAAMYSYTVTGNSAFSQSSQGTTIDMAQFGAPNNTTTTFVPASFSLASNGVQNGTMKIQTTSQTQRGTYTVFGRAFNGLNVHSVSVSLVVQ